MLLSLIVFSKSAKNLTKDNNNRDSVIVLRNPNNLVILMVYHMVYLMFIISFFSKLAALNSFINIIIILHGEMKSVTSG